MNTVLRSIGRGALAMAVLAIVGCAADAGQTEGAGAPSADEMKAYTESQASQAQRQLPVSARTFARSVSCGPLVCCTDEGYCCTWPPGGGSPTCG